MPGPVIPLRRLSGHVEPPRDREGLLDGRCVCASVEQLTCFTGMIYTIGHTDGHPSAPASPGRTEVDSSFSDIFDRDAQGVQTRLIFINFVHIYDSMGCAVPCQLLQPQLLFDEIMLKGTTCNEVSRRESEKGFCPYSSGGLFQPHA